MESEDHPYHQEEDGEDDPHVIQEAKRQSAGCRGDHHSH
jgi:hypothetical protein